MLLAEFDPTPRAVINPDYIKPVENFPETVVAVFSHQLFASVTAFLDGKRIAHTHDADGAMGARRFILLGNCGVLDKRIEDCGIIPTNAIRDEGTSYHYAPASDLIDVNTRYIPEFIEVLREFGYPYVQGAAWTTDAFYRETPAKVAARRRMGAVCVEMECAVMQAMCDFRGVEFFQYFYAGDNLDHPQWDPRSLSGHARLSDKEKIALLAFELASRIG